MPNLKKLWVLVGDKIADEIQINVAQSYLYISTSIGSKLVFPLSNNI